MKKQVEWDPKIYSDNSHFQYEEAIQLIDQHVFKGNEKVLDIGCGDGKITDYITTKVPHGLAVGIDSSSEMILHAQQNYKRRNLSFSELSAEDMVYHEEFDMVFSSFCLHWIADKEKIFKLIYNCLKTDGQLLCAMVVRNEVMAQARTELLNAPKWKPYFKGYKDLSSKNILVNSYMSFARTANFKIDMHEVRTRDIRFDTREKLSHFLRNITPCLTELPEKELKDAFMQEYVDSYLALQKKDEVAFQMTFEVVVLKAQKCYRDVINQ
jgi:trans-aconitate methyltransferase